MMTDILYFKSFIELFLERENVRLHVRVWGGAEAEGEGGRISSRQHPDPGAQGSNPSQDTEMVT